MKRQIFLRCLTRIFLNKSSEEGDVTINVKDACFQRSIVAIRFLWPNICTPNISALWLQSFIRSRAQLQWRMQWKFKIDMPIRGKKNCVWKCGSAIHVCDCELQEGEDLSDAGQMQSLTYIRMQHSDLFSLS